MSQSFSLGLHCSYVLKFQAKTGLCNHHAFFPINVKLQFASFKATCMKIQSETPLQRHWDLGLNFIVIPCISIESLHSIEIHSPSWTLAWAATALWFLYLALWCSSAEASWSWPADSVWLQTCLVSMDLLGVLDSRSTLVAATVWSAPCSAPVLPPASAPCHPLLGRKHSSAAPWQRFLPWHKNEHSIFSKTYIFKKYGLNQLIFSP